MHRRPMERLHRRLGNPATWSPASLCSRPRRDLEFHYCCPRTGPLIGWVGAGRGGVDVDPGGARYRHEDGRRGRETRTSRMLDKPRIPVSASPKSRAALLVAMVVVISARVSVRVFVCVLARASLALSSPCLVASLPAGIQPQPRPVPTASRSGAHRC
jgi:hypothetical protein